MDDKEFEARLVEWLAMPGEGDPYPQHADAIKALGDHFGLTLDRARCYPYRRA